jgi:hypothetical protein
MTVEGKFVENDGIPLTPIDCDVERREAGHCHTERRNYWALPESSKRHRHLAEFTLQRGFVQPYDDAARLYERFDLRLLFTLASICNRARFVSKTALLVA